MQSALPAPVPLLPLTDADQISINTAQVPYAERSPKRVAMDTLLYEFDMLRHCAATVDAKKTRFETSNSDADKWEYYLGIEGFLLHLRNVFGFFINKRMKPTDLTVDHPEQWAGEQMSGREQRQWSARAMEVNKKYGLDGGDCYEKISWFLQHRTTHRHERPRSWDISRMFADIEPVLNEFVDRFAPAAAKAKVEAKVTSATLGHKSHHTATVTVGTAEIDSLEKP